MNYALCIFPSEINVGYKCARTRNVSRSPILIYTRKCINILFEATEFAAFKFETLIIVHICARV